MTVHRKSIACVLIVLVASWLIAGCGGSKAGAPIPSANAGDLTSRLIEARNRSTPLRCHDLQNDTIKVLENDARSLPQNVDQSVRTTVSDGIAHLRDLVQQQCEAERQKRLQQQQQQTTSTDTNTQPPTPQPTPPPSTTQTTPPPTATTPPPSTPSPTKPPPSNGGGGGGVTPPPAQDNGGNPPPGQGGALGNGGNNP